MKILFEYTDYRIFLKDVVLSRRKSGLPASNRWFAQKMGINSNAWLTYILNGRRNLNSAHVTQLIQLLKLNTAEGRYFEALVQFNQSRSIDERNRHFRSMEAIRATGKIRTVVSDQFAFYSVWYHSAIRSLVDIYPDFKSFEELGSLLTPPVTASEVKKSISLLESLELIVRDENGVYHIQDKVITSGTPEKNLAVANFQRETMKLAVEALDRVRREDRDISTMTIGVSQKAIHTIQQLLQETRKQIAQIASEDANSDRVYHLNLHLFPLSKPVPIIEKEARL